PAFTACMTGGGARVTTPSIGEVMMMTCPFTTPWELVTRQRLGIRNHEGSPIRPTPTTSRRMRPGDDLRAAGAGADAGGPDAETISLLTTCWPVPSVPRCC